MFQKAAAKLALLYLAIIMTISLFFSINLYQLSVQELNRGLRKADFGHITDISIPPGSKIAWPLALQQLQAAREQQYNEAKQRILQRLIMTNLLILAAGGLLSYYLAQRTLRPIEEANEAQARFTADASHELRTPIAAMRSEIEVALMNPKLTLNDAKGKLRSNLEELARLTDLSEGLLRLAQMEHGDMHHEPVLVQRIVQKATNHVLPLAEKKNVLITANTIPERLRLPGDEARLTEVLVILLDNAVKYSPEKTEVSVQVSKHARSVRIQIKDQGIGIKATELPHIFDRFYRADAARNQQRASGYGIGLAIAKNIVEQHGGSIAVTSKPGKGTTFSIVLPT